MYTNILLQKFTSKSPSCFKGGVFSDVSFIASDFNLQTKCFLVPIVANEGFLVGTPGPNHRIFLVVTTNYWAVRENPINPSISRPTPPKSFTKASQSIISEKTTGINRRTPEEKESSCIMYSYWVLLLLIEIECLKEKTVPSGKKINDLKTLENHTTTNEKEYLHR